MQRPVMDPTFTYAEEAAGKPKAPKGVGRGLLNLVWRIVRLAGRVLFFSPLGNRAHFRNEDGSRLNRIIRAITYRLAFVPILLVVFLTALVFAVTHPGRVESARDPLSTGVYYDPVNFLSEDGARLDGWLVSVVDAKRVL